MNVCFPQNFLCQNPNAQRDSIKRGASMWRLGHEGGAFVNGVSAFMKEIPQSFLAPSATGGYKTETWKGPPAKHASSLTSVF